MGSIRFCGATGETALGKAAIKPISGSAMRVKTAGDIVAPHFLMLSPVRLTGTGTASGDKVAEIARAHPHLTGIGFDLPTVCPVFERYVAQHGLDERLTFQAGDFFKDPLPGVDVLVMGHILHDWSLEEKKLLLRKAHEALPSGGALIVYDAMIDDERCENAFGLLMSLNMLIETPAGFDYTGADCRGWMQEAGFNNVRIEPLQGPYSMAVGQK
jgi:hypothetical protein